MHEIVVMMWLTIFPYHINFIYYAEAGKIAAEIRRESEYLAYPYNWYTNDQDGIDVFWCRYTRDIPESRRIDWHRALSDIICQYGESDERRESATNLYAIFTLKLANLTACERDILDNNDDLMAIDTIVYGYAGTYKVGICSRHIMQH